MSIDPVWCFVGIISIAAGVPIIAAFIFLLILLEVL